MIARWKSEKVGMGLLLLVALLLAACAPVGEATELVTDIPGALETAAPGALDTMMPEPTTAATEAMETAEVPVTGGGPEVVVSDQSIESGSVTIDRVVSDGPGWIVIHIDDGGSPGPVIGYAPVVDGENTDVVVELNPAEATETLFAMLHVDAGEVGVYEFPGADIPAMVDNAMISPPFTVTGAGMGVEGTMEATEGAMTGQVVLEVANSPELGDYLVDGEGMTLYYFTMDEPGVSNCTGGCLEAWPPLLVDSEDQIQAGEGVDDSLIGTIPFEDGGLLVTYDEWPLYYWVEDQEPGDTTGHGVNDVWFVMPPEGLGDDSSMSGVVLEVANSPELGDYLVDGEGMTLYLFTMDEPGVSNCTGGCLVAWPPLLVDSEDQISAGEGMDDSKIGTIPFAQGGLLVTYDGAPLYYWVEDEQPGDTTGHGVNDVWFVVAP